MGRRAGFWLLSFCLAGGIFAGAAFADVGDSGLPFWAMQFGSNWGYNFSGPSGSGSVTHAITERSAGLFPETVFQMTRFSGGDPVDPRWYSVSLQSLKLWRASSWDDVDSTWLTYTFDTGVVSGAEPPFLSGTAGFRTGPEPSRTIRGVILLHDDQQFGPGPGSRLGFSGELYGL